MPDPKALKPPKFRPHTIRLDIPARTVEIEIRRPADEMKLWRLLDLLCPGTRPADAPH